MTIYLIVFAGLLSFTNYIGSRVLMSLYALDLGTPAVAVGALISLYAVFPFAVSVYAGRLVDRFGSIQPMLLGNAGSIAGLAIPCFVQGMFGGAWVSSRHLREESVGPASDILLEQSRPHERGKDKH